MRIALLRHGMTAANENRLYCGHSDPGLTARGRQQLIDRKRSVRYPDISGWMCITSGMQRTNETLQVLFGCNPDIQNHDFREMNFGRFEMHSYDQLKDDANYQRWICDETGTVPTPGGESSMQFKERVLAAFAALERDALVVCHGGVIAAIMAECFPREDRHMYQWQPDFGLGYVLEGETGGWSYRSICE